MYALIGELAVTEARNLKDVVGTVFIGEKNKPKVGAAGEGSTLRTLPGPNDEAPRNRFGIQIAYVVLIAVAVFGFVSGVIMFLWRWCANRGQTYRIPENDYKYRESEASE